VTGTLLVNQTKSRSMMSKPISRPADHAAAEGRDKSLSGKSLVELITVQWQRERGDLDLSNFLLAIYLMRLGSIIERTYDRLCVERYRISGSDMRVLFALRRGGHPYVKRPTDLFKALLVTSGAMTKKVDRLGALGFVERLQDPGHLGGFLVRLTRKGLQVADEMTQSLATESVIAPATGQFTAGEREQGSRFALRMLIALEAAGLDDPQADDPPSTRHTPRKGRPRTVSKAP
jgi:DNA-binding MarR family transcriptional regulator